MKLTIETVAKLTCPSGSKDALFFDETLPGFGVRVGSNGGKVFVCQFRVAGGVRRRVPLGRFGTLTPTEARAKAKTMLGKVADGKDPVVEEQAAAEAKRVKEAAEVERKAIEAYTFRALTDAWLADRKGNRRASYLGEAGRSIRRNFAGLLDRPAGSITVAEAVQALDTIKKSSPVQANRALSYGRAAYSWAVRRQAVSSNPFKGLEKPSEERARERVLTLGEVGAIWRASESLGEPYGPAVRLLVLTAARRDEISSLSWAELDDPHTPTVWTLPAARSKNRRSHSAHLAEPAREILRTISRRAESPLVFPGRSGRSLSGWSLPMAKLRATLREAGHDLGDWRLHDFRRSAVTWMATSGGVAPHVADKILNHVVGAIQGVAAVYQRAEFATERRVALDAWAEAVVSAAEGRAPVSNVVFLRG